MTRPGHVLVLIQNMTFPGDRRVRLEARALADAGHRVTVVAPAGDDRENAPEEDVDGIRVLRFAVPLGARGAVGYLREYGVSLLRMRRLVRRVAREAPVDVVFLCNPPDFLILLALGLKRRGAGVVFDHHDLSPELFERKFGRRGLLYRVLRAAERFTYARSDAVIEPNRSYAEIAARRGGVTPERLFLVHHSAETERIYPVEPRPELRRGREHLVLWIGLITALDRVVALVDAAEELVVRRGRQDVAFAFLGTGDARDELIAEVARRGLQDAVDVPGPQDGEPLRAYLSTADVCVSVDRRNPMNDASTVTKVIEYMTMGRPIVQFPLAEMQRMCADTCEWAREDDVGDLADRIEALLDDRERAEALGRRARERALEVLSWDDQIPALLAAVERAAGPGGG